MDFGLQRSSSGKLAGMAWREWRGGKGVAMVAWRDEDGTHRAKDEPLVAHMLAQQPQRAIIVDVRVEP